MGISTFRLIRPILLLLFCCQFVLAQDEYTAIINDAEAKAMEDENKRPLQVFLEVNIFEVLFTDTVDIGLIYDLLGDVGEFRGNNLAGDPNIESDLGVLGSSNRNQLIPSGANVVAEVLEIDDAELLMTIQALSEDDIVRIHANPILLTIDGRLATLKSGDDIPFLNRVISNNNETVATEYLQTGVELRITPHVRFAELDVEEKNPFVFVNIDATLSSVTRFREEEGFLQPIVDTRQYKSNVWVKGGQRILIGSIFQDSRINQTRGIPLLMDIPLLGRLFRSSEVSNEIAQLIVLIRPAVYNVWAEDDTELSTAELQSQMMRDFLRRKTLDFETRETDPFLEFRDIFLDYSAPEN